MRIWWVLVKSSVFALSEHRMRCMNCAGLRVYLVLEKKKTKKCTNVEKHLKLKRRLNGFILISHRPHSCIYGCYTNFYWYAIYLIFADFCSLFLIAFSFHWKLHQCGASINVTGCSKYYDWQSHFSFQKDKNHKQKLF